VAKEPYLERYPPTTLANALILHTPLIRDLVCLAAILLFATGFRIVRINRTLNWVADEPISLKIRGRRIQPSLVTLITSFAFAGFSLYLLQLYLVAEIGGPVTRLEEKHAIAPLIAQAFALTAVFTAPLVEELQYRGVFFIQAYGAARKLAATVISVSIFAIIHLDQYSSEAGQIHWGAMTSILSLGLFCCLCRAATDRVWPAFVVHTAYNVCVAVVFFNALAS
jgi:membrane protease YdiL (CAAX protease family)